MRTIRTAACVGALAGSASAQPDMLITVDNTGGDQWQISAEFLSPFPGNVEVQVWAYAGFDLAGDGSAITITSYNPSYDTAFGPASVTNGPTASFVGQTLPLFATPDLSNPLSVLDFTYAGSAESLELSLVGLNAIVDGLSFGSLILYQDSLGNPGTLTWDVRYIPAPATLALAPIGLVATRRRRK
ncbi:MAG: hypothetical protein AAFO89_01120 [Planctomycetota bacterium]